MEFQNYMFVQIIFLLGVLLFLGREIFLAQKQSNPIERKQLYLLQLILFIGVLVRLVNLSYPNGVFVDEAMGAYDSWCLANFGVDSNLASYPIYLKSWGTGQSALYAYITLPFIKLFGLNAEAYRLPMALLGSIAILFFYWALRKTQKNTLFVFCISTFFAINPWHIIKCRFGLDCNIFPDLLLIAVCFIILSYYSKASWKQSMLYIIGFGIMSFSAYGYGVSWLALPFLYILLLWYLFKSGRIRVKTIISSILFSFLFVIPLLLFVYILFFDGDQISIGQITITKLTAGRHGSTTLFASENFLPTLFRYLKYAGRLFIFGVDNMEGNSLPIYGIFYNVISLPFLAFGLYRFRRIKDSVSVIFFIWLISCLLIILLVEPNVNHWNMLWFPFVYFTGYGIYIYAEKAKENQYLFLSIYTILFAVFLYTYFDKRIYDPFNSYKFEEEIIFSQNRDFENVYYPADIIHSFILFYAPIPPSKFENTRENVPNSVFAKSYDNVIIGLPEKIEPKSRTAYILSNYTLNYIDLSQFKVRQGKYYSVIWND